jgi:hypothetical protein
MFTAQFVQSHLISSAHIDTALILLPSLLPSSSSLQDESNIFCIDLIEIFLSHIPYCRCQCKTPPLTSWVPVCGRGCNVHLCCTVFLQFSGMQLIMQILLLSHALLAAQEGASSGAIPVATMALMLPSYAHFPQNIGHPRANDSYCDNGV